MRILLDNQGNQSVNPTSPIGVWSYRPQFDEEIANYVRRHFFLRARETSRTVPPEQDVMSEGIEMRAWCVGPESKFADGVKIRLLGFPEMGILRIKMDRRYLPGRTTIPSGLWLPQSGADGETVHNELVDKTTELIRRFTGQTCDRIPRTFCHKIPGRPWSPWNFWNPDPHISNGENR